MVRCASLCLLFVAGAEAAYAQASGVGSIAEPAPQAHTSRPVNTRYPGWQDDAAAMFLFAAQQQRVQRPALAAALAPGEVLLEVSGSAVETAPVARAKVRLWVMATGATLAEARSERDRIISSIRSAARAAGAQDADVKVEEPEVAGPRLPAMIINTRPGEPASPREEMAAATVEVVLQNPAGFEAFKQAAEAAGARMSGRPDLEPVDDAAARRASRARALAAARAEAEAFAASIDMRVVRMVRINERAGPDIATMMMGGMMGRSPPGLEALSSGDRWDVVSVPAFLAVDFVLAPR
jgi:uncharacterized protein